MSSFYRRTANVINQAALIAKGSLLPLITPEAFLLSLLMGIKSEKGDTLDLEAVRPALQEQLNVQRRDINPTSTIMDYFEKSALMTEALDFAKSYKNKGKISSIDIVVGISVLNEDTLAKLVATFILEEKGLAAYLKKLDEESDEEESDEESADESVKKDLLDIASMIRTGINSGKMPLIHIMGGAIPGSENPQFSSCLTDMMESTSSYKPLINRKKEIERTIEVLSKMERPNPMLIGLPGVGKTAVAKELAKMIKEKSPLIPAWLSNAKMYSLAVADLMAGTRYRGDMEQKLKMSLESVSKDEKPIIFIDEIHMITGSSEQSAEIGNILKPYLTDSNIAFIGATTPKEYMRFQQDAALSRRFEPVYINEPSVDDAISIVQGTQQTYENFHKLTYEPDAVTAAVELSAFHIHDRFLPGKAFDILDESGAKAKLANKSVVTCDDIKNTLTTVCNVPAIQINDCQRDVYKSLSETLKNKVFGQEEAVKEIVSKVLMAKAGLLPKDRPIGSFLCVGPTGVGKTELAKVLAETLEMKLLRFDMSEYSEEFTVSKLIGSPAGYVGYEEGGLLTNAVKTSPSSIVLLDEIEKAHPKIYNTLLQIMDYGMMSDNHGSQIDFRNTIIIMTSNCGAASVKKKGMGFGKETSYIDVSAMDEAVSRSFSPEFIGRLSSVLKFNSINKEMAEKIVKKEIEQLKARLAEKKVVLKISGKAMEHIIDKGFTPERGARELKSIIEKDIAGLFVEPILFGFLENGGTAKLDYTKDKLKLIKSH